MKVLKKESGFSLIEVIAAIVIIGIVLISFSQLFFQSNRIAYLNSEKLVVTNLADGTLEEIQASILPELDSTEQLINYLTTTFSRTIMLNNKNYYIKTTSYQNISIISNSSINEEQAQLMNVKVTVYYCKTGNTAETCDKGTSSSTEGYISYAPI